MLMHRKYKQIRKSILRWGEKHIHGECYLSDTGQQFPTLGYAGTFLRLTNRSKELVAAYRERCAKRKTLNGRSRKDPLFDKIEHVFHELLGQFLNEINYFQYDRIRDAEYTQSCLRRMEQQLGHAAALLEHYGDYTLALKQSEYENTAQDRESIAAAVKALCEVVQENR